MLNSVSLSLLLTSEVAYRLLVGGEIELAVFLIEADGTVATWNAPAQRVAGFEPCEIIGQPVARMFPAPDIARGEPDRILSEARKTGHYKGTGWRIRKDGSRYWASVVIDALHDDDGQLIGFAQLMRDVTERSIKGDQRRAIVDAAAEGILIIDETGAVVLANQQAERLLGYAPGALAGLAIERLLVPDPSAREAPANSADADCATLAELRTNGELSGRRRDGDRIPLAVRFNVTATASGSVTVAAFTDISERRRAEAERRRSEAALVRANRLMSMAEEIARCGHWHVDLVTGNVTWSDDVYRTFGLSPATYTPEVKTNVAAFDPNGVDVVAVMAQAARDGLPYTFETRVRRPDGTFRDVRCAGRPELDAAGRAVAIVGIIQDITEAKNVERERERLLERVTLANQAANVGIWEWSLVSGALTWDAQMFVLYGLDPAGPVPTLEQWQDSIWPGDRGRIVCELSSALAKRAPFDFEFRIAGPNGEIRTIRGQGTVVCDTAGEVMRMVGTNTDISELRNLSEQLQEERARQLAYERERLYERERKWSTTFQRAVLPLALPEVAGCTFDALYEPGLGEAQVGGDWYDAVHLIDGRILVSIGDVAGSGLEAAVVVGVARQIMRGISQLHANPMLILDAADRALCLEYPGVYVSAWVGLIDLVTRTITYASAGHPPPLLVSSTGKVRELDDASTLLIGLRENHYGQASAVALEPNDTLVLYTDGLTEAGRDVIAGGLSLREAAAAYAPEPYRRPAGAIRSQVIPTGSLDDVALLVVRTDVLAAERCIERWRFDVRDAGAAGAARAQFVASLERRAFSTEERAAAELVFSELIGNVVRHAAQTTEVEVAVDHGGPHSVLHVLDRGSGFYHVGRLPSDPYAENGRGLFLVAALSVDFTVSERPDGGSHARVVLRRDAAARAAQRRPARQTAGASA
ncbi:MAG: SpoIIE family protein phosphatase [Candidatus Velthaea sp.]